MHLKIEKTNSFINKKRKVIKIRIKNIERRFTFLIYTIKKACNF